MPIPSLQQIHEHPYGALAIVFVLSKTLLLSLACLSPGLGYDTSTDLLFELNTVNDGIRRGNLLQAFVKLISAKLVRWDAIYFISSAKHGYINEQDWAFGWGVTTLIGRVARYLSVDSIYAEAFAGILLSNVAHFLCVLVLYSLARTVIASPKGTSVPLVASVLHIISPAGLFLSAPVAESLFSLLHMSALLSYCRSSPSLLGKHERSVISDTYLILSGALFAIACTMRSNGLFSGIIYAYDLVVLVPRFLSTPFSIKIWRQAAALITAGSIMLLGFVYPQFVAYKQYCQDFTGNSPAWCSALPPSITTHVQVHYWNNGFLKYWTLSNVPLFLLAAPMLAIMLTSCYQTLARSISVPQSPQQTMLIRLALPQSILAVLTLTTFHVQIITRISSGYPLIYIWLASKLVDDSNAKSSKTGKESKGRSQLITRWMVIYAIVQGGLFASFLPPA